MAVFTVGTGDPPATPQNAPYAQMTFDPQNVATLLRPCTILLLNKENALHNSASLIEAFMVQMSILNILGTCNILVF